MTETCEFWLSLTGSFTGTLLGILVFFAILILPGHFSRRKDKP